MDPAVLLHILCGKPFPPLPLSPFYVAPISSLLIGLPSPCFRRRGGATVPPRARSRPISRLPSRSISIAPPAWLCCGTAGARAQRDAGTDAAVPRSGGCGYKRCGTALRGMQETAQGQSWFSPHGCWLALGWGRAMHVPQKVLGSSFCSCPLVI